MLAEYNHYIHFRAHPGRITKINYKIDKVSRDVTIRIERDNQPLSLTVMEKFGLKQLGFTEWIEVQTLASKGKSKASNTLLRSLKENFEWVKTQAGKLGISPPPELTEVGLTLAERKRKRTSEIVKEVFFTKYVHVDGTQRNLTPPPGVVGKSGQASEGSEDQLSAQHQLMIKGLADIIASASNLRDIQVRDIIKEVKDHLKTYSPTEMDIICKWNLSVPPKCLGEKFYKDKVWAK
ncbi:hypothetical protein Tco_0749278 [Tanacetum coccineum]|uniref:Uncharacterized protein n=1 Tax=Tanacetum coccineum TaxID=301880 RepID=A0ABQ4Z108_9ASTR